MPTVRVETEIKAPVDRCFDLARSQRAHVLSTASTGERIVRGPAHDLLQLGDEVTFRAKHLGFERELTGIVTEFEAPHRFVDEMIRGAFQSLRHEHLFEAIDRGTRMIDVLTFGAPMAPVSHWILAPYMKRFLERRNAELKRMAEEPGSLPYS